MVILAVGAALLVAVAVPRLTGATPYTVLTGSMRPGLPPGTLVVVRPAPAREIKVGDVITYQLRSGEPAVVTHRVVAQSVLMTGETRWQTQGDANDIPDTELVREEQIRGVVWYSVPELGRLNTMLTGNQRQIAVTVVAVFLLGYASVMFVGAARGRRRETNDQDDTESSERLVKA